MWGRGLYKGGGVLASQRSQAKIKKTGGTRENPAKEQGTIQFFNKKPENMTVARFSVTPGRSAGIKVEGVESFLNHN